MKADKQINSLKDLEYKDGLNKFDTLAIDILSTLSNLKDLDFYYIKYKEMDNNSFIIEHAFNQLKQYILLRFYCEMRDYSDTLYALNKNKKYNLDDMLSSKPFLKEFIGKVAYTSLSVALHNINECLFCDKKIKTSFDKYEKISSVIWISIEDIKKEFETLNNELRKLEGIKLVHFIFDWNNTFPIFSFIEELLNKNKK